MGEVVRANVISNILKQENVDTGGRIKANAPSTRDRKRAAGRPQLSLVDKLRRFLQKATYKIKPITNGVSVSIGSRKNAKEIALKLMKAGYVGWFGLSKKGFETTIDVIRKYIDDEIKKASRKRSTKVAK